MTRDASTRALGAATRRSRRARETVVTRLWPGVTGIGGSVALVLAIAALVPPAGEFERGGEAGAASREAGRSAAASGLTPPPSEDVTAAAGAGEPPPYAPAAHWAEVLPGSGREWVQPIVQAAGRAGVDPRLLAAVVWAESDFDPDAVSRSGAIGLSQLMPGTASRLGVDPRDPEQNLEGGARYLGLQLKTFGRPDLAVAAYKTGPGKVEGARGIPATRRTRAYVTEVLGHYRLLGGVA